MDKEIKFITERKNVNERNIKTKKKRKIQIFVKLDSKYAH